MHNKLSLEGSGRDLIEAISRNYPGGSDKYQETNFLYGADIKTIFTPEESSF
jgi:hypothetical protein